MQKKLGLNKQKAKCLLRKCRTYISTPIYDGADEQRIVGILSVDSMREDAFTAEDVKAIEAFARSIGYLPL